MTHTLHPRWPAAWTLKENFCFEVWSGRNARRHQGKQLSGQRQLHAAEPMLVRACRPWAWTTSWASPFWTGRQPQPWRAHWSSSWLWAPSTLRQAPRQPLRSLMQPILASTCIAINMLAAHHRVGDCRHWPWRRPDPLAAAQHAPQRTASIVLCIGQARSVICRGCACRGG